jgi:hypothetical protein
MTLPGPQLRTLDQCGSEVIKSNESNFSFQLHSPFKTNTPTRALRFGAKQGEGTSFPLLLIEGEQNLVAFRVMVGM